MIGTAKAVPSPKTIFEGYCRQNDSSHASSGQAELVKPILSASGLNQIRGNV